jgi:putative membrane protein insertion efficiency factor
MGKDVLIALIRIYQRAVSPFMKPSCRFYPSCSEYAVQALGAYGLLRGTVMAAWRVMRCNPWCRGGFDPVRTPAENAHDG